MLIKEVYYIMRKIRKKGAIKFISTFNEIENQLEGWPDDNETVRLLCKASVLIDRLMDRFKIDPATIPPKKQSSISKNKCLIKIIDTIENGEIY